MSAAENQGGDIPLGAVDKKGGSKMKISQITLNWKQVANADYGILIGIRPWFEYVNGEKTDKVLGTQYEVVLPENGYEKLIVKVQGSPILTEEEIKDADSVIHIGFTGFIGKIYFNRRTSQNEVSAKAAKAMIVHPEIDDEEINLDE